MPEFQIQLQQDLKKKRIKAPYTLCLLTIIIIIVSILYLLEFIWQVVNFKESVTSSIMNTQSLEKQL